MPGDAVAEIKARLDIVDVVGGYVRLQRSGRSYKALCPFHSERTPSFNVSQERQAWFCFGCSEGGDVFSFVQKHEHLDFAQALEMLAERAGVELERRGGERRGAGRRRARIIEVNARAAAFFEHVLWSTPAGLAGRALLDERGVPEELARLFGIGFAPSGGAGGDALSRYLVGRNHASADEVVAAGLAHPMDRGAAMRDRFRHRLVFPIRDERGHVLGFGGRALGDAVPKYLNTPGTDAYDKSTALFGIDLARPAIAQAGCATLVEGYFDVVAAAGAGVRHAVASSGTALTRQQVRLLARFTRQAVLCFDADEAGQAAATRAVDELAAEGLEARICVLPPGFKDPDELVRRDPDAFVRCVAEAAREWQVLLDRAIGEAEGGSVEDRRAGADRAIAVLARIPEASARELYTQQAGRRLGIEPATLLADVAARLARAQRGPVAARLVVAPPPPPVPGPAPAEPAREEAVPAWEQYIGSVAVQRPEAAPALLEDHGLAVEDLASPAIRRLVEEALALPPGTQFPMHHLGPAEQGLAARLVMRAVPELADDADPELLGRALHDCVRRVRGAALLEQLEATRREQRLARDAGRSADAEALAVRYARLAADYHALADQPPAVTAGR